MGFGEKMRVGTDSTPAPVGFGVPFRLRPTWIFGVTPKRLNFLKEITCDQEQRQVPSVERGAGRVRVGRAVWEGGRDGDQCQGSRLSRASVTDRKGAPPVLLLPLLALGWGQGLRHLDRAP